MAKSATGADQTKATVFPSNLKMYSHDPIFETAYPTEAVSKHPNATLRKNTSLPYTHSRQRTYIAVVKQKELVVPLTEVNASKGKPYCDEYEER